VEKSGADSCGKSSLAPTALPVDADAGTAATRVWRRRRAPRPRQRHAQGRPPNGQRMEETGRRPLHGGDGGLHVQSRGVRLPWQAQGKGKPHKVAVTAVMRRLVVTANVLLRDRRMWEDRTAPAAG